MNRVWGVLHSAGADRLWRRWRPPAAVVMMCHSVGEARSSAFDPNGRWRISQEELAGAIGVARDAGYAPATLNDVLARLSGETAGKPLFLLTFDDGYADNLHAALPVCHRLDVPMTTYVTSGFVARKHVAWWHFLERLIADEEAIDVTVDGQDERFDCRTAADKSRAFERLAEWFTHSLPTERAAVIEALTEHYGSAAKDYAQGLFLDELQLGAFAAHARVTIGAHGVSHNAMARLSADEAFSELQECRRYLRDQTGTEVAHLAYPFGTRATVSPDTLEAARRAGFASAVTTRHGCVNASADPLALPRVGLFPGDTRATLSCKLSGLTTTLARLAGRG